MPLLYSKQCIICGRFYTPSNHNQILCGDRSCKLEYARRSDAAKRALRKARGAEKKMLGLTQDSVKAEKLGISYGEFKGRQWCMNKQTMKLTCW